MHFKTPDSDIKQNWKNRNSKISFSGFSISVEKAGFELEVFNFIDLID